MKLKLFAVDLLSEYRNQIQYENKSAKLKKLIKGHLLSSTVHAVPNIIETDHKIIKIIWTIFLAISTSGGVYFCYKNIIDYFNFDVTTRYEIGYDEWLAEFPSISFCSSNGFSKDSLKNILHECVFNSNPGCTFNKNSDFKEFKDDAYGICFRFNSDGSKTAYTGYRYGLHMKFNLNNFPRNTSLIINIHNHSLTPATLFNRENYVTIGSKSEFSIMRSFIDNLPHPYNDCYEDVRLYPLDKKFINLIINDNRTYTQLECMELCSYDNYFRTSNCGCNSTIRNAQVNCYLKANSTTRMCTLNFVSGFLNSGSYQKCLEYCPLECDSSEITIEKHSVFTNDETSLRIYYENLKYTVFTQQPKTLLIDVVSEIGGVLGLFLGISFLSFVELIALCLEALFVIRSKEGSRIMIVKERISKKY